MPLPLTTHHRRGMGCGGGRPTTHRGDHRPPPHPVPGPTNQHSAVWSVRPGTGSNGEHCPRAIGDWSPPFGPMPLPLTTHHRRGMGYGGGRPTTHRGVNLRRRRTPCPARPIVIRSFGPMPLPSVAHCRRGMGCGGGRPTTHRGVNLHRRRTPCPPDQSSFGRLVRLAGTGSNGAHCPRAIGNRSPPSGPMPLPLTTHHRRGMGCGGGRPTTHRGVNLRRRTPCPARPIVIRQFGPSGRARGRTAHIVRARLATGRRRSAPCPYRQSHIVVGAWGAAAGDQPPTAV